MTRGETAVYMAASSLEVHLPVVTEEFRTDLVCLNFGEQGGAHANGRSQ